MRYAKDAQHPQYGKIRHPKLDKGDFVFQIATAPGTATAAPAPATATPVEVERQRLAAERQRLEDERRLLEERQRLTTERRSLEVARQRLETARSYAEPPPVTATLPPAAPSAPASTVPFFMTRSVSEDDLRGKSTWELEVMRNEIYARHGRRFARRDLQRYFEQQPWYRGQYAPTAFPNTLLSAIQQQNAVFIQQYQQRQR